VEQILTDFDKHIYNSYLAAIAKAADRPFRVRKNFDKFEDEKYTAVKKISEFLNKTGIDPQDFFSAPFYAYNDEEYKTLDWYTTPDAVTAFTRFKRHQEITSNEDDLIKYTKKGLLFIVKYCLENNLCGPEPLKQYGELKTESDIPLCLLHLKEHKINFYCIHALDFRNQIYKLDKSWRDFYIRDFDEIFRNTYKIFSYSSQLKPEIKRTIETIERKLNK
jgi:hypothetical protein